MIRLASPEDLNFVYSLYMHPTINPYLLYDLMEIEAFRPIYQDLIAQRHKYIFSQGNDPLGMFKLFGYTHRTAHIAYLGGLAIHPDYMGKGVGISMLTAILTFAQYQGYKRIELSVSVDNAKAINIYEKAGFVKEGVLRKYTYFKKENRYIDEVLMSYLC